ncbi:AMP-binding enzyme family protein [Paraburkholderia xenovorans LB400]|uniref:AMP-dependent synthetase and ligase n=1 Tax=Paraburkholderia xenovorans (strain LB400) TaxID=266265 RepID=Q13I50_PARXL|nr:class I adenylate-forming enzyme family protein [Paraburkholderia xenovorans]ABE36239.1 Putative AMP-dependent synthetase and ligase [Paraburkholderia xenovorans LB400]AIP34020.1 AMP-binding enzyme family protein [Paraburkholderia xenovorans LB400]
MSLSTADNGATRLNDSSDVMGSRTLWDLVQHCATLRPSSHAVRYLKDQERPEDMQVFTWDELASLVWEMRCRLAHIGVRDQRTVVLALPGSPLTIVLWLAIASNGAVVQAVDPDAGVLPLCAAIRATQPVLVIANPGNAEVLSKALVQSAVSATMIVVKDLSLASPMSGIDGLRSAGPQTPPSAFAESVAGMLQTSGTSGAPKLVELTHANYIASGERLARNSGHRASDCFYLCSPFSHTNAQLYCCMPAIVTGGTIAVVERFSASLYFDSARQMGATVSSMVAPPMRMALHKALERGSPVDAGSLRLIQYGMNMSDADWRAWDRLFPQIEMRQVYGQTESVSAVLGGAPWEIDDRRTIGRPFLGVDAVRLVGENGEPVKPGEQGELWVRGERGRTLMRGYYQNEAATAEAIDADGWLHTGDYMTQDANGRFAFVGRRMHIIRRGGENLSVYELELMMQSCPLIEEVAISAEKDALLDATLVVHVIPASGFSEQAFEQWCRDAIGRRGVPDSIRVHQAFPRTISGRVIIRELK